MSEENLEVQEEDVEAIEEGKASFGDPSETPEPTTPKGGTNHKRSADKTAGDKAPIMQGSSRLTKAGMIAETDMMQYGKYGAVKYGKGGYKMERRNKNYSKK